ncbi:MAG TPA: iron dependent repressor, metal binding and dimerization domain protein [Blastocatellia bacterium]|nr:iron dependent repressor, metal binding and dimerization domain protein [Blastocatellia bacterium]
MHQRVSEEIVEVLEAVWTNEEKGSSSADHIAADAKTEVTEELLAECEREGYITRNGRAEIRLTARGRQTAEEVIRRHRLAERLVVDVLGMTLEESEADACEFEHLLARGVTDAICTLLGHPRHCPHHHPIPAGDCCRQVESKFDAVVTTADRLNIGEPARVAYISARNFPRIQKLASLGISPGVPIKIHQRFPSFVIQCEETQIALEEEIARDIYVWRD